MSAAAKTPPAFRFSGAPGSMSAMARLAPEIRGPLEAELDLSAVGAAPATVSFSVSPQPYADLTRLRLRVPRNLPPGIYQGKVTVEGEPQPIIVEVQPLRRMKVFPTRTFLESVPGAEVAIAFSVANLGNISSTIPRAARLGLFPLRGMDDVIGKALEASLEEGERRVDRFFEALREVHGGMARCRITKGSGALEPGETVEVEILMRLPDRLQPGRTYRGNLSFDDIKHRLEVRVASAKAPVAGRDRGRTP